MVKQAKLAKEHGIYGFAYYHYWFNGKRLLETPLDNMLKTGKPDFPFCYIWANENWSKRWDGTDDEIIIRQDHNHGDDINHITFLCKNVFCDHRYIRIDNKPLFLIYRTELIPDIKKTVKIWRQIAKENGFKDLYLVRIDHIIKNIDPEIINFNAAMEFGPDMGSIQDFKRINNYDIIDYENVIENMLAKQHSYKTFNCIFPGWDNSPRRKKLSGTIFINNRPELFKLFMNGQINNTLKRNSDKDEQILFINAWNEWGEGCHIEPDVKHGYVYLEICKDLLLTQCDPYNDVFITNYLKHLKRVKELERSLKFSINVSEYKVGRLLINILKFLKRNYHKL
jgi:lipopolysaccharide biosynthesis protein